MANGQQKSAFASFLESGTATALVTVLMGGLLGQLISCDIQNKLKDREFNDAWLKSRADQALTSRKEYLEAKKRTFDEVIGSAADMASASEDLLYVTSPQYNLSQLKGSDRDNVAKDQAVLVNAYRTAAGKWAAGRFRYDFQISYFAEGNANVGNTWGAARTAVDALRGCANNVYTSWYLAGQGQGTFKYAATLCQQQRELVVAGLRAFGSEAAATADYSWRGWDNPMALRKLLGMNTSEQQPTQSSMPANSQTAAR
jgi:hypothetical protein